MKVPDLTDLWNEAVFKSDREEITIFEMNECWGALKTLQKHGLCELGESE